MKLLPWLLLTALMAAGCAQTPVDPDGSPAPPATPSPGTGTQPGPGFAPQQGFDEDINGDLHLIGTMDVCEDGYCVEATASIEGVRSYYVSNRCVPPHDDSMERDGVAVQHREPTAYCAAFGLREWTPGEPISFHDTWDAQVWDDEAGQLAAAAQGAYQWTLQFHAWDAPDGGELRSLAVTFTVVVGET